MEIDKPKSRIVSRFESFKQGVAVGVLTGLAITSTVEYTPAVSRPELASLPSAERTLPPRINDLHMLLVDAPSIDSLSVYNEEYVKNVVNEASVHLSRMTAGAIVAPENLPLQVVRLDPSETYQRPAGDAIEECYGDKQLHKIRDDYITKEHLPDDSRVSIVLKDVASCYSKQAGAAAWADTGEKSRMAVYDQVFDDNIFLHEEGHLSGLAHAAAIDCAVLDVDYNNKTLREISEVDIKALIQYGCAPRKRLDNNNLKVDEYGSYQSVMGSYGRIDRESDRYNFVELNQLVPDVVQNQWIGTTAGEYSISLKDHEVHMLTFAIGPGHPLRSIDPTIDRLSIGVDRLDSFQKITPEVHMIAVAKGMTYELAYAFPYALAYDQTRENLELYHDETLGVRVLLNPGDDDQTVKVTVEPLQGSIPQ